MRTNKLIHLYRMAGDKSHSSFLMWTVSGFSHTNSYDVYGEIDTHLLLWTWNEIENDENTSKKSKVRVEERWRKMDVRFRSKTMCWINLLKNWNYLHWTRFCWSFTSGRRFGPNADCEIHWWLILEPIVWVKWQRDIPLETYYTHINWSFSLENHFKCVHIASAWALKRSTLYVR